MPTPRWNALFDGDLAQGDRVQVTETSQNAAVTVTVDVRFGDRAAERARAAGHGMRQGRSGAHHAAGAQGPMRRRDVRPAGW
ncbi:hypothetical protein [Lentzea sp. NPDC051838]|uniref:hypothetical protein n=1 Tax=Lentzea sp. NPDC051838 TaxID=3154849 RepID=UPI003428FD9C